MKYLLKSATLTILFCLLSCNSNAFQTKSGTLTKNETWSGEILIKGFVAVPKGVTLTIKPGTIVKFKHVRGYDLINERKGVISVDGGTIRSIGTKDKQIWFTSDAKEPVNGDWGGFEIYNSYDSIFDYVIVEYANLGIGQYDSKVNISNSIVRWSNSEGLYAERSSPIFKNNTLYANGYHEIALEQYNKDVVIENNIFGPGHCGIMVQNTNVTLKGNYFHDYRDEALTVDGSSKAQVISNIFYKIGFNPPIQVIYFGNSLQNKSLPERIKILEQKKVLVLKNNEFVNNQLLSSISTSGLPVPKFIYKNPIKSKLDYIPGDKNDRYMYIYPAKDKTRKVIKKIGQDTGSRVCWSLAYANGYLWKMDSCNLFKINPDNGTFKEISFHAETMDKPRGLAWDGKYFWVLDYGTLKINKFKVENDQLKVYESFDIPEKEKGGTSGITVDDNYIYVAGRDSSYINKLDKKGRFIEKINLPHASPGPLLWTGNYFWTIGGPRGLVKLSKDWKVFGSIYPPAEGVWAMAWDGKYLWCLMRTSEMWDDPKIYKVEILDDSL